MITRTILIQPKSGIEEKVVTGALVRFHSLRENCSGIYDVQVAKSSHPDYLYGVVIRYTAPPLAGGLFHQKYYEAIVADLQRIAHAIQVFDVGGEKDRTAYLDETDYAVAGQADGTFAYGNFKSTIEERLRQLVRLWMRGNGQLLTDETNVTSDPEDSFGFDLAQLDSAIEGRVWSEHSRWILSQIR